MPLYEYQCTRCDHRFEVIQKFSEPPRTRCPACRGSVKKLLSAPAIQFKGTGWYVTDYARKGGGSGKSTDSKGGKGKEKAQDESGAGSSKKGGSRSGGSD